MATSGELPQLQICIRETETKDGAKPYTVYKITIEAPSEGLTWRLDKRYSDLNDFHHTLKRVFKDVPGFPRFPGKKLVKVLDPAFIEQRRAALEEYLRRAFSLPPILRSQQLRAFLASGVRSQTLTDLEAIDIAGLGRSLGIDTAHSTNSSSSGRPDWPSLSSSAGQSSSSSPDRRASQQITAPLSRSADHRYSLPVGRSPLPGDESAAVNYAALPVESVHYFAMRGDLPAVQAMVEHDPSAVDKADEGGHSPLVVAIKNRQAAVIEYLLSRGASADAVDLRGVAPLIFAAQRGDHHIFSLILTNCRDAAVADPASLSTPLHLFAQHFEPGHPNEERLVDLMIAKGARVAAQDRRGNVPLHYAAQQGNLGLMKQLIAANSPIDQQNEDDETPLHFAARAGKQRAVSLLVQEGADVNLRGKEGTPLDLVLKKRAARQTDGSSSPEHSS